LLKVIFKVNLDPKDLNFIFFPPVFSACPSTPDISIYLTEAKEKSTQACDEVVDYYISEVGSDENIDDFKKGIKEASGPNYDEARRIFGRARSIIQQSANVSSQNFSQVYWNGGFMDSPLSCYNKILSQVRIEDEKSKVEYESLVTRLSELFEFYLQRRRRSKKTGSNASLLTTKASNSSTSTAQATTGKLASTIKTTTKNSKPTKTKPTGTKTKKTTKKFSTTSKTKAPKKNVGSTAPILTTTKAKVGETSREYLF
jgi:hypothetical protein